MIRLSILGFALGAAWLQTRAELPALAWLWLAPPIALAAFWLPGGWPRRALVLALMVAAGFFHAAWRAESRLAEALPPHWEGRQVSLVGRVLDLPESTPRGTRFQFAVESAHTPGARVPQRLQLTYAPAPSSAPPELRGGDCLRLTARLFRPHGQVNPHGFDYEAWLLERGIRATGYLMAPPTPETDCGGGTRAGLDALRDRIRADLRRALDGRPYAGVVIALAIGDQNAIPAQQWTLFRHTGVTHLMSISGLHVTLFSSLVFLLVQRLWRLSPRLCLRLPARKAAVALGLGAAAGYVALAGFGIPAQRTLCMLAAVAAFLWAGRLSSPSRTLAAALLLVVAIDPWAALSPGFWLSFGAVAALFYAGAGRLAPPPLWLAWLKTQYAVSIALLPALLALFHEVSLVSPLANAFAIPLVSLVAVPLSLLAAALPWDAVAIAAHAVLAVTLAGLEWLDALPQPIWHGARAGPLALALSLLGAAVLLLPRGVPGRWLGVFLFLPLLFPRLERPAPGEAWLTVLDVGQGLAAVVRTAGHVLVFDAGPLYPSGEDAGVRIVAPWLHAQGVRRVDMLIVSHDDSDHSGGALSLAASHRPRQGLASLAGQPRDSLGPHGQAVLAGLPVARPCVAGQAWTWDGVAFRVLHPPERHYRNPHYADNDRSCVLQVMGRHGRLLLPADIERLGEMSLLERLPGELAAEILVAPHHGSKSSSMPAFLDAVRPDWVVIPVGHRNRYGHPAGEVLARYRALGARILRTDRDGALDLRLDADGVRATRARELAPRYWRDRPSDGLGASADRRS